MKKFPYKFLILLVMLYLTADLASDVVVFNIIKIGNHVGTAAMIIFPITYLLADVLTEVYGYSVTRQVIWYDLICSIIFASSIIFVIHLPSVNAEITNAYNIALGHLLHIASGAFIGELISNFANIYLLSKLNILTRGRYFWLRSVASSAIGIAILLFITNLIAFTGFTTFYKYLDITITTYFFQIVFIAIIAAPTTLLTTFIKKAEGLDQTTIDYVDFNPFKLNS